MPEPGPPPAGVRILAGLLLGLAGVTGPAAQTEPAQAELARYIVKLTDPPLATRRGGIAGLLPTNPEVLGGVATRTRRLSSVRATPIVTVTSARYSSSSRLSEPLISRLRMLFGIEHVSVSAILRVILPGARR